MSEFSTGFSFDLQRFATQTFKGAAVGDETGVTLSDLFTDAGAAKTKKDASSYSGGEIMWDKSALVDLTPTGANASVAGAIMVVSGKYDSVATGDGTGYVVSSVTAVDAHDLGASGSATFKNIGNTTILNPAGTITVGNNTVTFSGGGTTTEDTSTYGDAENPWNVGTVVNVKSGSIKNVEAAAGEVITTADSVSADFVNGGTATFDGKSFATITSFSDGSAAQINVNGGDKIVLQVNETATSIADGKAAITTAFDGQAVKSVTFAGKNAQADIVLGGTAIVGKDVTVGTGTINVANIAGASTSQIAYKLGAEGGDVLDITNVEQVTKTNKVINVASTGKAKFLIAKDYNADTATATVYTDITVGGVTYSFNDENDVNGNGGVFEVTNGKVTGFVFREDGDSIVIPKGTNLSSFNLYEADKAATTETGSDEDVDVEAGSITGLTKLGVNLKVDSSSSDYILTKQDDESYTLEVFDSTTVSVGDATMGFTLPTTKDNKKDAPTSAVITISKDGELQSVEPGNKSTSESTATSFDVAGVAITFSGMNSSNVSSDFQVAGVQFATESGNYAYTIGATDGSKEGTASTDVALKMTEETDSITKLSVAEGTTETTKVILAETESAGDDEPSGTLNFLGVEYKYSSPEGKARLEVDPATPDNVRFVFYDVGDSITIPEDSTNLTLYYQNNLRDAETTIQELTYPETDGEAYSITMTQATTKRSGLAKFELFGIAAGDKVLVGEEAEFEFGAADGKFIFSSENVAAGFIAASGTVTMNTAAATYLAQANEDAALFEINGTGVNITATTDATADTGEVRYNKDENSLYGLADGSVIRNAGSITKIYAPTAIGTIGFGDPDSDEEGAYKEFTAQGVEGDIDDTTDRAFFTVDGDDVTGFTFADVDDEIRSIDFSGITLTDKPTGNTFDAPIITDAENAPAEASIIKTLDDNQVDCYLIETEFDGKTVALGDGTVATFTDANDDTEVFFTTGGKLRTIANFSTEGNEVAISNATGAVDIDSNVVEILGGGFVYRLTADNEPSIVDVKADTTILQAAGVSYVTTAGESAGEGAFTFGASAAAKTFTVSGNEDGVRFNIDDTTVTGIDSITGTESVTGALNGLALNGASVVLTEATAGTEYTFSGTSFAGLKDGDAVTTAGNVVDFFTAEDGTFTVLGESMAVAGDSAVKFSIADGALTAVSELSGTATGDFSGDLTVNSEDIKVTGDSDSSVAVTGTADESAVASIANVGGSVALEEIGSASQVITNADGTFNFVEAEQTFTTSGSSDGVVFGLTDGKVTAIDDLDQHEAVKGNFSGDGVSVNGSLVQVENNGTDITVITGGESGTGIYGLKDGASVVSASGINVAVLVEETGSVTFANGTFNVAGDSNGHVGFMLDSAGNVTSVFDLDETATITGALSGISINNTDDPIQIGDGNDSLSYSPNEGIGGVVDGNTVTSADGASKVFVEGDNFSVTFGSESFSVAGASGGVTFLVTDKNNVVGVEDLAEGATLTGALGDVTAINGASFSVLNDNDFAVVGAASGISEIQNLSASATVAAAGGATLATTDEDGEFTFGDKTFTTLGDSAVEFTLNDNNVTNIGELSGIVSSASDNFNGVTVNGQSFAISGDQDDLSVVGTDDASGIKSFVGVGGESVTIANAGGASAILTNTSGTFNFTQSNQSFTVADDDVVAFNLTDNAVSSIEFVEGTVEGNFDGANTVNGKTFDVTDSDGILRIGGNSDASGIETISKVNGGAVINNVGGATQVITESTGSFSFAGHTNPFEVTGDESVTFNMDANEDAKVLGITDLANGAVKGEITDFSVNGASIAVEGDEDDILTYAVDGEDKTLGEVGGNNVTITESGEADEIELVKDGVYDIDGKEYDIAAGGSATLGMNGMSVASIDGIDQDGEQVKGDFTETISVGGQNVQVLGDEEVTVAREDGQLVISGLNDGATIEAADDIYKANVEEAGTFADTDAKTVNVGSDSAIISLDGAAHIVGLSNAGNVGGDISGLVINGKAPVSVISAATEEIPEVHDNTDLTYENGVLGGVIANDTVISAGDASVVSADGEDGSYTFGTGTDAQVFALEGDGDGVEFAVKDSTVVTAVNGVGEDATLKGALNGLSVNGSLVSIAGDDEFDAVGAADGSRLKALEGVGGDVTVVSAGGAEEIRTDAVGNFTFNKSGQKFAVAGDSAVTFGIDDNESVTFIRDLDGTVAGDFRNEINVNSYDVQVTNDADGVSVVGGDDGLTVNEINDVEANASVVSSGNASVVGTAGEGVYTFVESGDRFSVTGDAAVKFALDDGDVTGVYEITSGDISFTTDTTRTFDVNPTINDQVVFGNGNETVTLSVDENGKLIGVGGTSAVAGLADVTVKATEPMYVNGKFVGIKDADDSFNVVVNEDGDIDKVTAVTGNATIAVADGVIETDADGEFIVNGETYTVVDNDNKFGLTTDQTGDLTGVTSVEGSIAITDGAEELTVNGQYVEVINVDSDDEGAVPDAVTIAADGTNISVAGMLSGGTINGDLANASIAVPGNEGTEANDPIRMHVNDLNYEFYGDENGVTVNGSGGVRGLDDGAYMYVNEKGTYNVNGEAVSADVGDYIMGADTGAYLYDPDNILVRKSTPLSTIATLAGVPTTVEAQLGTYSNPITKDSLQGYFDDETFDWDRPMEIYTTNPDERSTQTLDFSGDRFTKKVHLFNGPQNLAFNNDGGNVVHVAEDYLAADGNYSLTSGIKNIVLGDGAGDLAVIDMKSGLGNAVNIAGGTGADSIFVRDNVDVTFDMSDGGADRVVTFAKANARIKLENYDYTTGAGIKFDQHETRDIASAIKAGNIAFGDGVVSLKTASGATEISVNSAAGGTASVGGTVVNLFTPEGTRQVVGFTHAAGGEAILDASYTEDVIFIGNSDGKKEGGSTFQGGSGNDTAFAGEGDVVDLGEGVNVVSLQDDVNRKGAYVRISAGNTVIENTNSTLDEIHGDTLGVDLTQMELEFDGSNLIVKSKEGASVTAYATVAGADKDGTISYDTASELASSADLAESADESDSVTSAESTETTEETVAASAVASPLVADHNYTNQLINSNGTLVRAAIGATGSVIDVKLDEDVRANYYKGDNSGLTFGSYNGRVLLDLEGDQFANVIDDRAVIVEGINSVQAGTEFNYIKGSDENETFFAGRGETHLYGDGGKNMLVGYTGDDKEGQTTFYVLGHSNDAANTIQAFDFVSNDNYTNNNRITADKLEVDLNTNYVNRVELSNNDVVVNVTNLDGSATESVIIQGVVDSLTGYGQDILISGDGVVADVVAQVGGDKLNFDKFANYYNAAGKNATVDVANDKDFAQVWLDGSKGTTFVGDIHDINASEFIGAAELAGNDYNNVIYAGSGETSLWGGHKGDDAMYAGTGKDTFFYTLGNGTDTIFGAKDGDVVNLAGVTLDQIVGVEFSGSNDPIQGVALNFRDGGKLYIGDNGTNDVNYVVNGETYIVNEDRNGFTKKA